jgi:hypothetical protein
MKKKSNFVLYALLAVAVGAMIVPTVIVLSVALVPTAVAFIMERKNGYYGGLTVGAMNMAGTVPYLTDLWFHDHSIAAATHIVTSVLAWAVFYASAAAGWAIYAVTPNIVSSFIAMTAGRQITSLRAKERELVQIWGPDVEASYEPVNPDALTNGATPAAPGAPGGPAAPTPMPMPSAAKARAA